MNEFIQGILATSATNRWALVGLANSLSEASDKCAKLQEILCKKGNVKPYGISELLQQMADDM